MDNYSRSTRSKRKHKYTLRFKKLVAWVITFAISCAFIIGGNAAFKDKAGVFNIEGAYADRAKITRMADYVDTSDELGYDTGFESGYQYFYAEITSGEFKGQEVLAVQTFDSLNGTSDETVRLGDKVILYNYGYAEGDADWIFGGYSRLDTIIVFASLFCIALLIFGGIKGINTIVALAFTCLAVFAVFIPAVLSGQNIYLWACIICVFTIPMTLMITEGPTKKALTTILGCASGVAMAAILALSLDKIMRLTGVTDEHSLYLTYFDPPINLHGIIFAMVVIGAMGAVMDVAMDISSSLHEIHIKLPELSFAELFKSGMTIGRDVMGTMANTLVLAYIGSSLCSVLLMISYTTNLRELLNKEGIIVEIMNGLTGSCAILLAIPLTSLICAAVYKKK